MQESSTTSDEDENYSTIPDENYSTIIETLPTARPPAAIVCFQHCIKGRNIFCSLLPATCPSCHQPVMADSFTLLPYCIFAPWTSSLQAPCTIVLKPTTGSFLRDYNGCEDLHVGIADSNGAVTHYDEGGVRCDPFWTECLSVAVDPSFSEPFGHGQKSDRMSLGSAGSTGSVAFTGSAGSTGSVGFAGFDVSQGEMLSLRKSQCGWDNMISIFKISWRKKTLSRSYNEIDNNCFDFVWAFIEEYYRRFGDPATAESRCRSKNCFTEHFFLPTVEKALKFIQLSLAVAQNGFFSLDD